MKNLTVGVLLLLMELAGVSVSGQTPPEDSTVGPKSDAHAVQFQYEMRAAQLEEIAMCHHTIKAAKHDGLALGQNPYYRYIVYSPRKGSGNVYPIPERCKRLETDWILGYTNMHPDAKAVEDKNILDAVRMTTSDIANDAEFLTVVVDKMQIEGEDAIYEKNQDKDVPKR